MTGRQCLHLNVWRREAHLYCFTRKLTILTTYHIHKMQFFIQPQRHLSLTENSIKAIESGTSMTLHCVLWCDAHKPLASCCPQTWWPPCGFAIRSIPVWGMVSTFSRSLLVPLPGFLQRARISAAVPEPPERLARRPRDGSKAPRSSQLQYFPCLGESSNFLQIVYTQNDPGIHGWDRVCDGGSPPIPAHGDRMLKSGKAKISCCLSEHQQVSQVTRVWTVRRTSRKEIVFPVFCLLLRYFHSSRFD